MFGVYKVNYARGLSVVGGMEVVVKSVRLMAILLYPRCR